MSPDGSRTELEGMLLSLRPVPSRINRDRLMFQAGRESVRPADPSSLRTWLVVSVLVSAVSLAFGVGCLAVLQWKTSGVTSQVPGIAAPHFAEPQAPPETPFRKPSTDR